MIQAVAPTDEGFAIDFDWAGLYVSPVFVLQAVDPEFSLLRGRLVKTAQFFEGGE